MARSIANINGKEVFSDKKVSSIVNTRITFSDGSWCDVATGQVVNKGAGYINIGSPAEDNDKKETMTKSFSANRLQVDGLSGNLQVQVGGDKINVKVTAPKSLLKDISVSQSRDTVLIEDKNMSGGGGTNITMISRGGRSQTIISGGGSIISGSNIVSNGDISIIGNRVSISTKGESEVEVVVTVPKGTAVSLNKVRGMSQIGDIKGDLDVNASGSDNIQAGSVRNVTVNAKSSADVKIKKIDANFVNVTCSGSADVDIKNGKTVQLLINASGSADVKFGGQAQNANLGGSGSADIYVNNVVNRPLVSESGSADVQVGNW